MNKEVINKDENNNLKGYQEWYDINGRMELRGYFKNHEETGYVEEHIYLETNYYIR